jgi:hypothetical protein
MSHLRVIVGTTNDDLEFLIRSIDEVSAVTKVWMDENNYESFFEDFEKCKGERDELEFKDELPEHAVMLFARYDSSVECELIIRVFYSHFINYDRSFIFMRPKKIYHTICVGEEIEYKLHPDGIWVDVTKKYHLKDTPSTVDDDDDTL